MMTGRGLARGLAGERRVAHVRRWLQRAVAQGLEEAQRDLAAPLPTVPAIVPAETQAAGWSFGPHVPRRRRHPRRACAAA